jgi:hypothetical protein
MIEAKATLLSWEKRPNDDFRGIFAFYPRLRKDPPTISAMKFLLGSFKNYIS